MASIEVPPDADLVRIATLAGNASPDGRRYQGGWLTVDGVPQEALDRALADVGTQAVVAVPDAVSPLQARRALRAAGLLQQVEAAVSAADEDTRGAWQYALTIERRDSALTRIAAQMGVSQAQIDDLFRSAASL